MSKRRTERFTAVRGGPGTNNLISVFVLAFLVAGLTGLLTAVL